MKTNNDVHVRPIPHQPKTKRMKLNHDIFDRYIQRDLAGEIFSFLDLNSILSLRTASKFMNRTLLDSIENSCEVDGIDSSKTSIGRLLPWWFHRTIVREFLLHNGFGPSMLSYVSTEDKQYTSCLELVLLEKPSCTDVQKRTLIDGFFASGFSYASWCESVLQKTKFSVDVHQLLNDKEIKRDIFLDLVEIGCLDHGINSFKDYSSRENLVEESVGIINECYLKEEDIHNLLKRMKNISSDQIKNEIIFQTCSIIAERGSPIQVNEMSNMITESKSMSHGMKSTALCDLNQIDKALKVVQRIQTEPTKSAAISCICLKLVEIGDTEKALSLAANISRKSLKGHILCRIEQIMKE